MNYILITDNKEIAERFGEYFSLSFNSEKMFLFKGSIKLFLLESNYYSFTTDTEKKYKYIKLDSIKDFDLTLNIIKWKSVSTIRESIEDDSIIINICEPSNKGQCNFNIFRQSFLKHVPSNRIKRLWMHNLERETIITSLNNLESDEDYTPLAEAEVFEIATNLYWKECLLSQFTDNEAPTFNELFLINLIHKNHLKINEYVQDVNIRIQKQLEIMPGTTAKFTIFNTVQGTDLFASSTEAIEKMELLCSEQMKINDIIDEMKRGQRPLLYNEFEIVKDSVRKLSISENFSKQALEILFERGYISNPFTTSRHLKEDDSHKVRSIFEKLTDIYELSSYINYIRFCDYNNYLDSSVFNNEFVGRSSGIMPTGGNPFNDSQLSSLCLQIYRLITLRFLSIFMPSSRTRSIKIDATIDSNFSASCNESYLIHPGFKVILVEEQEVNEIIEKLKKQKSAPEISLLPGQTLPLDNLMVKETKTSSPPTYNLSSILVAMENFGKRNIGVKKSIRYRAHGIGEPSDRGKIIDEVLRKGYIVEDDGKYYITQIAEDLISAIPNGLLEQERLIGYNIRKQDIVNENKSLQSTTEHMLFSLQSFIKDLSKSRTELYINYPDIVETYKCPICEMKIVDKGSFIGCSVYPKCKLYIPKVKSDYVLRSEELIQLLQKKETKKITGFKFKTGIGTSRLQLTKEGRTVYEFQNKDRT